MSSPLPQRPISPHLQIYQPQLTWILSISHRLTGLALSVGALFLVWWLIAAATGPGAFAAVQGFFGSWIGLLFLLGWTFCFFFHLGNGIRHLVWDAGFGFTLPVAYRSGWTVVGASVILTAAAFILGLVIRGHA
ncbi:MAG TPA: succinate dehydrogenase, cytochrome b556 subunit [Stellaceae bacterium]|nr:succinate dehydrogenase, cytochrome b556 subunit [Stellaceae bacterium]